MGMGNDEQRDYDDRPPPFFARGIPRDYDDDDDDDDYDYERDDDDDDARGDRRRRRAGDRESSSSSSSSYDGYDDGRGGISGVDARVLESILRDGKLDQNDVGEARRLLDGPRRRPSSDEYESSSTYSSDRGEGIIVDGDDDDDRGGRKREYNSKFVGVSFSSLSLSFLSRSRSRRPRSGVLLPFLPPHLSIVDDALVIVHPEG